MNSLDLLQRVNTKDITPTGWFDPRCCILFLHEITLEAPYDPNSTLAQMARALKLDEKETEELRDEVQGNFNKFLDGLPKDLVDEWKRSQGVSEDYDFDPAQEFTFSVSPFQNSQATISPLSNHVSIHEYCHYLQFVRTIASPMLIWAFMNLIQKADILFRLTEQTRQTKIQYPIKLDDNSPQVLKTILDDPALWKILSWHYERRNFLNANDIREAEAEFNSLLSGKHFLRFSYYQLTDHPVTLHFRELNKSAPQYARAYLETASALGDFAPSLFPLITYFALSMPFKRYSWFNIEDFEPVHPEEAFQAALRVLEQDVSTGHPYASYAQKLYQSPMRVQSNSVLEKFCTKVCKANGWIYPSSRNIRNKWIKRINSSRPFLSEMHTILDNAYTLERKFGNIIYSEPVTANHGAILRKIPPPPIVFPQGEKIQSLTDDFWAGDFVQNVVHLRVLMGIAFSIFVNANVENDCPHLACPFRELNLCHGVFTYPESADTCGFPGYLEDLSGLPISAFIRRR